jgi:hypothetical protein
MRSIHSFRGACVILIYSASVYARFNAVVFVVVVVVVVVCADVCVCVCVLRVCLCFARE